MTPPVAGSPAPLIVADVGGTYARLAWANDDGTAPHIDGFRRYQCAHHPSLAAILSEFAGSAPPAGLRAVVAIAGLLQGDTLVNANLPWPVAREATRRDAGLHHLQLINDFEAVATTARRPAGGALPANSDRIAARLGWCAHW